MHPGPGERPAAGGERLRGLVLVVREHEVDPAAVDVELEAEQRLGHRRALDVPAGAPAAPGRVPRGVLALLLALPQREVERVPLAVGALDALALVHLLDVAAGQLPVGGQRAHAEVDVPVGHVGVVGVHERGDQVDDRADRLRGQRLVVGAAEPEPVGVGHVGGGHLARELVRGDARLDRGVVDLVVDVGDVDHQRDREALVLEEALEQQEGHVRPRVADVHARVHGGPAGVDAHPERIARVEPLQAAGAGVVQRDLAWHGRPPYPRRAPEHVSTGCAAERLAAPGVHARIRVTQAS